MLAQIASLVVHANEMVGIEIVSDISFESGCAESDHLIFCSSVRSRAALQETKNFGGRPHIGKHCHQCTESGIVLIVAARGCRVGYEKNFIV